MVLLGPRRRRRWRRDTEAFRTNWEGIQSARANITPMGISCLTRFQPIEVSKCYLGVSLSFFPSFILSLTTGNLIKTSSAPIFLVPLLEIFFTSCHLPLSRPFRITSVFFSLSYYFRPETKVSRSQSVEGKEKRDEERKEGRVASAWFCRARCRPAPPRAAWSPFVPKTVLTDLPDTCPG